MPYLQRGDTLLHFDVTGSGAPVITTHGWIENGSYWGRTGVSAALAQAGFQVADLDLRGHGRSVASGSGPVDYGVEAIIADIAALADALGFERFHLLTHATGGMAGALYAMRHHRRLLSLVLTDCSSATMPSDKYAGPEWDDQPFPAGRGRNPPGTGMAAMVRAAGNFNQLVAQARADPDGHPLSRFFLGFAGNVDPDRCWRWTEQIYAVNNLGACADFAEGFFRDPDPMTQALRLIACPTLVMVGEQDVFLRKSCDMLARNIPGARLRVLAGLGHMLAIEDPARTIEELLEFLPRTAR